MCKTLISIHKKAFTNKDGTLVYEVRLYIRIDDVRKVSDILKHFGQCGPVRILDLIPPETLTDEDLLYVGILNPYAYVIFTKFDDAYEALRDSSYKSSYRRVSKYSIPVEAVDSCMRPFIQESIQRLAVSIDPQTCPIFNLNDDCLMHLFTFLSLSDQFKLSRLSERFERVFGAFFRRKHRKIVVLHSMFGRFPAQHTVVKMFWNMTPFEWKLIIEQYGYMVESLIFYYYEPQMNDCVGPGESIHCPNLQSLLIYSIPVDGPFLRMVTNLKTLSTVELRDTCLNHQFAHSLSQMKSLQVLRLNAVEGITGEYFDSFRNLKELSLIKMPITHLLFKPTVTKLIINECAKLSATQCIANFGENLRELEICTSNCDFARIRQLPKLEKLHVYIGHQIDDGWFIDLVPKLRDTLRVLRLDFSIMRKQLTNWSPVARLIGKVLRTKQMEYICELKLLEELILNEQGLRKEFLPKLLALPNLKHFESSPWSAVSMKDECVHDFLRKAPKLEILKVDGKNYFSHRSGTM